MNVLADESVEAVIVERLRADGHVVISVAEQSPGLKDPVVLAWAVRDHLLLLTADRDSGDMIMRDLSRVPPQGVVLVRLKHTPPDLKALMVVDAFIRHGTRFRDAFSVVTRGRVRRRPLP